ncbi:hypothetical protein EJ05DRAFT_534213 [Pseudovirgaria hyperparasitica]|uniref:Aminoglycoside phosphotransferase domain-containing protein n=1 Tax=Pseudovirgaria hyperparasitica TaxID=470096 RepID=A0A6A6WKL9_9PEZI|nr:uncharacterized protein EJ05DRAFT_534213 [Pseudovirgaria hyperparasitica]KAF2762717.1 hypothetical protein EJ05DRAFT_534213 [Pseudovirgaria hyperparasitica]
MDDCIRLYMPKSDLSYDERENLLTQGTSNFCYNLIWTGAKSSCISLSSLPTSIRKWRQASEQRPEGLSSADTPLGSLMAWVPVLLPYAKAPGLLPAPLPSETSILESTTVFRDDVSHHRVVAVGSHFIAKHGKGVIELEGQVLLFLEHHLKACSQVPKLYAMYRIPSTGHMCLIMQRMPGETLDSLWPGLSEFEKSEVCTKLKELFTLIRDIPAPPLYGSVDGSRFDHYLFYSRERDREICGPFDSEEQFNGALVKRLRFDWARMGRHSFRADFYERNLGKTLAGHRPVFSHSDLQRKNVVVLRDASRGFEVSLIDFEEAGWFPTYWEYFTALQGVSWDDDWAEQIEKILDPWINEAVLMAMVHKDLIF